MSDQINPKTIAFFFNTNQLGGAERSGVLQMQQIKDAYHIHYFVPCNSLLGDNDELVQMLTRNDSNCRINHYWYPDCLYTLSRSFKIYHICPLLKTIPILLLAIFKLYSFQIKGPMSTFSIKKCDYLYCNGTKAFLLLLLYALVVRYKGIIVWHFRDYPPPNRFALFFRFLIHFRGRFKVYMAANSDSVKEQVMTVFPHMEFYGRIYNPVEKELIRLDKNISKIRSIGIVAMYAPWKGIHDMILFAALYESELKKIGIERVNIFARSIYKTSGEHHGYESQVKQLKQKLKCNNIYFFDKLKPEDIYPQIDILIHSSRRPEPFGRVILEAFRCKIPVISTGLGGARELIHPNITGHLFNINEFSELFLLIKNICSSDKGVREIIQNAYEFEELITNSVEKELKLFLKGNDFEQETENGESGTVRS